MLQMHTIAPNLSALIGEMVGARLISHAGSLTNLAKYPASTVQILGAEKALFRWGGGGCPGGSEGAYGRRWGEGSRLRESRGGRAGRRAEERKRKRGEGGGRGLHEGRRKVECVQESVTPWGGPQDGVMEPMVC